VRRAAYSRRHLLIFTGALPVALLVSCGGQPPVSAPAVSTATPAAILEAASARLAETQTVGFALDIEGDTFIDAAGTIRLLSATGDLQRPDRVRTEFKASVLGRAITLQLITIGDETWLTNIVDGRWGPAPAEFAYKPDVLFDNQDGIGPVMGRVTDVTRQPDEEIGGRAAYRLSALVPHEVIGPLTYNTITGSPVTAEIWVDSVTNDLLRARLIEPPQEGKTPAVWTLDLTRHGQEVEIAPPM
jgi:lipoprotein LprG